MVTILALQLQPNLLQNLSACLATCTYKEIELIEALSHPDIVFAPLQVGIPSHPALMRGESDIIALVMWLTSRP
jgi:hypothetical protein